MGIIHSASKIFFQHRAKNKPEQKWRSFTIELSKKVTQEAKSRCHDHINRAVIDAVGADATEKQNRRKEQPIGYGQQANPNPDQRQVEHH